MFIVDYQSGKIAHRRLSRNGMYFIVAKQNFLYKNKELKEKHNMKEGNMVKKNLLLGAVFFLFMAWCLLPEIQGPAFARGRIIYIYGNFQGSEPKTSIEPKITTENRNTTIIFLNESEVDIKIIFPEGKTCTKVTRVSPGWSMKGTCFINKDTIPPGRTADIIFNSNGNFDYEVEFVGKNHREKAQIKISGPRGNRYRMF